MTASSASTTFQIRGGGITGELFRSLNWDEHALGSPQTWPQALQISLNILFHSQHPMFIWWGPELFQFYNDAYLPSFGVGKHPQAMGQQGAESWPEIWPIVEPQIEAVMKHGGSTWHVNQLVPVFRNGRMEEVYWTYGYSPIFNLDGSIGGTLVVCTETTDEVKHSQSLKEAKRQTEAEKAKLESILNQTSTPMTMLEGPEHRFHYANKQYEDYFLAGLDYIGKSVEELIPDARQQGFIALLDEVYRSGKTHLGVETPFQFTSAAGEKRNFIFNFIYAPLKAPDGNVTGVIATITDVTEQAVAREELKIAKAKVDALVSESFSAIGLMRGNDLIFEVANKEWTELVSPREYIGRKYTDVYPELVGTPAHQSILDIFQTGVPFMAQEMKLKVKSQAGIFEDQYFDYRNVRLMDATGKPYGVYCNAINVTDRVLTRNRIIESEHRLRLALTSGSIGFWDWNAQTNHTYLSGTLMQDWGIDPDTFQHTLDEAMEFIHPADREGVWQEIRKSTLGKNPYDVEYRVIKPNGEIIWVNAKGEFVVNERDEPERLTGVTINITAKRKAAESLQQANAEANRARREADRAKHEAEKANQLKSAFLANMSHEIRTPLGAMLGFADLLRDQNLTAAERSNYLDILSRNGESLSVIINDILDLSKVEAGHLTLEYTDTFPDEIATDIVSLMAIKANEKGLAFEYSGAELEIRSIISDPIRVRQILLNLVGNAIKFTKSGMVKIRGFTTPNEAVDTICFEVSDTGIGIPVDQYKRIFEPFVQADSAVTRRFGGTGLGLALSKSLAISLGGDVVLTHTEQNKGTTFLITIPSRPQHRNFLTQRKTPGPIEVTNRLTHTITGVRVLVIDDSPDNQKLLRSLLSRQGALVETADNGLLGYKKALAGHYDIILMDIEMPEMDGYTATYKLRSLGYQKPILALTAHAMNEVRDRCLNVGCTAQLTKPINIAELMAAIAEHTRSGA